MCKYHTTIARILLSLVFLGPVLLRLSAIMATPDGYLQYQAALGQFGLPGIFAPLLILVELFAGVCLFLGYKTKIFAYVLAGLALFLAIILGRVQPDVMFLYLGICGGMLLLAAYPITTCSIDSFRRQDAN